MLNKAGEYCGCTLEWYLHSNWMGNAFALVLYLFMNMERILFFSGVTRLLWRHICPDQFTLLATCDSDGILVTQSSAGRSVCHEGILNAIQTGTNGSKGANDNVLARELHSKLKRCIRQFYIEGCAYILASFVAIGLWIYIIVVTAQPLRPSIWR